MPDATSTPTSQATLAVEGMTCAACQGRVERALHSADGVLEATVNLATERARVRYATGATDAARLAEVVRKTGYDVVAPEEGVTADEAERNARASEHARLGRRLGVAAALTIPLLVLEMVPMMIPGGMGWIDGIVSRPTRWLISFALATAVQFGPGLRFYRAGWAAARHGSPDMNTLVALGTSAAYGYSVVATFLPRVLPPGAVHVYYEASAAIITLILLGKWIEARAKGRTSDAVRSLLTLRPDTARIVRDGTEADVPVGEVEVGEVVRIRPGERVPVDAEIVEGATFVDESMVTGEPIPAEKALGDAVSVLIISCPCAMSLATPVSVMVGTGKAAERGVLFRRGEALQTLSEVDVVALDKTGTLTEGRPRLTDLVMTDGADLSEPDLLALVASAEAGSEHPIGRALVEAAEARGLPLSPATDAEAVPGMGLRATVDGHRVEVGADRFMARLGLGVGTFAEVAAQMGDDGKTPLYAAIDGALVAILAVADAIRESTPAAIDALHRAGLRVAMVTGDNERTANAVARHLGIDEVRAQVLPADKAETVRELQTQGRVAFVGDGINDAPALAQADVGVAIGTGTDVAIEAADVVLMRGDLGALVEARSLSAATLRNIKQNLFWAFAYNVVLIPVAAGVLYPVWGTLLSPVWGAAAMGLSSLFVLANALRLRRWTPE